MDILSLDDLSGPVLVFGGPYSNHQATVALRAEARRRAIPADHCICTGDVVAYCADPQSTVEVIRDWGVAVVMGNCEQSLSRGLDQCGCGFEPGSTCDALSRQWFAYAANNIDANTRKWMASRPEMIRFNWAGRRVVALHGSADDIARFIFASGPEKDKLDQAASLRADVVLAGHSAIPFTQVLNDTVVWHNSGALGLPANDGTPDVWYSILTPDKNGFTITHHRLAYDYARTAQHMRQNGLGAAYATALSTGLWPSLDILPAAERAQTGRRITLSPVRIYD